MDAGLIIMLVCLGVFLILAIIGLAVLGRRMMVLYRNVTAMQDRIDQELNLLMQKQELVMQRVGFIQNNVQIIQERSAALTANLDRLSFLLKQFASAREQLRDVFSFQF